MMRLRAQLPTAEALHHPQAIAPHRRRKESPEPTTLAPLGERVSAILIGGRVRGLQCEAES